MDQADILYEVARARQQDLLRQVAHDRLVPSARLAVPPSRRRASAVLALISRLLSSGLAWRTARADTQWRRNPVHVQ
jgi:hypothetical protein